MKAPKAKNPWSDFEAKHDQRPTRRGGLSGFIMQLVFVMALSAGAGIITGALWHPGTRRHRSTQVLMNDTAEKANRRMAIGGIIGAVAGAVFVISVHRQIKKEDSQE